MSLPLYKKIKNLMLDEIETLSVNDPVPSERVLADTYHASRMTVRRAINELVEEGYLYRDAKRGTFVANIENLRKNTLIDSMSNDDMNYKVLYFDIKSSASTQIQKALNIRPADQIVRMVRSVLLNDEPYAIEEIYVETRSLTQEDLNNMTNWKSFKVFLSKHNVVTQRFVPAIVPVQYARLLNMAIGQPILIIENFITTKMGDKVAYVKIYHNPEKAHVEITT